MVLLHILVATLALYVSAQDAPSCDSKVFCQGNLLHTVQLAQLYPDSKTFVDKRMKNDEEATLQNFEQLIQATNNNPTKAEVQKFVDENFEEGNELEDWIPPDYTASPQILSQIEDEEIKNFLIEVIGVWPKLAKKVKKEVLDAPEFFTLLPVENGFIVPGGRFREFYYWDSYWIIKGLLVSDMLDTARGMLDNFLSIVEKNGFLPNGARKYYLNRSQPPLLTLMAWTYIQASNDSDWLQNNIKTLDKELRFWLDNRLIQVNVNGLNYTVARYDSESGSPRPESYFEDYNSALSLPDEEKLQLYADLKSGAESGWDFSSRWIVDDDGGNKGNITLLHTRRIIPVDLNSFLCQAFRKLAELYASVHDYDNALFWFGKANQWEQAIDRVLYNSDDGIWYDYDHVLGQQRKYFYPSNFAPLWAEAHDPLKAEELGGRAADYFTKQNIDAYDGGIPASLSKTGEQWDLPNAWPPLQSLVIVGLDKSGNGNAKMIAKDFAYRWITANIIGYNNTEELFEKYDAENPGQYGGGGEYTVQAGFGWTNGVVFEFIERFFATTEYKRT